MTNLVYRNFDQTALDLAYRPSATVPDLQPYIEEWTRGSAHAREVLEVRRGIAYGRSPDEVLDYFPARRPNSPVHVFFHGGYWRMLSKDESSFYAEAMVDAGAAFVAVNYSLAPKASLDTIVDQCRRAVVWAYKSAPAMNADVGQIYIGGHSAGGHLAAMMAVTDWARMFSLPENLLAGVCAVSGLFDLEPVRLSDVNGWMNLDAEAAHRNSPVHFIPESGCPMIVAWGDGETAEFIRQSREFGAAWGAKGFACQTIEEQNQNHFSVIGLAGNKASTLGKALLNQMGLSPRTAPP